MSPNILACLENCHDTAAPLFGGPLVPMKALNAAIPFSRSSIYRMIDAGTFPAPIKIGKKRVAWRAADLQKWLAARESAAAA